MKYTFTALALAALSLASPVPDSVASPPTFRISRVVSGGSGCPQGSIDINWTDNRLLPIYFSKDFTATVGPKADPVDSRKNCQINLGLQFTAGYSFAILSADYAGYADIDAGVTGTVRSTYYFSGQTDQTSSALSIPGPFTGRYTKHDDVALLVWSPCGGDAAFNVNSEVALTPLATPAEGTLASVREGVRFTNTLNFLWRKC